MPTTADHIQCNKSCLSQHIRHYSETFHKVKSCRRIQATCRIIPALHSSTSCHHFSDTNALSLSSGNTTNEFISDKCLLSMRDVQHAQQCFGHLRIKIFARYTRESAIWSGCFAIAKDLESVSGSGIEVSHTLIMRRPTSEPQSRSRYEYHLGRTVSLDSAVIMFFTGTCLLDCKLLHPYSVSTFRWRRFLRRAPRRRRSNIRHVGLQ